MKGAAFQLIGDFPNKDFVTWKTVIIKYKDVILSIMSCSSGYSLTWNSAGSGLSTKAFILSTQPSGGTDPYQDLHPPMEAR